MVSWKDMIRRRLLEKIPGGRWSLLQIGLLVLLLPLLPFYGGAPGLRPVFDVLGEMSLVLGFVGLVRLAWVGKRENPPWMVAAMGILIGLGGEIVRQIREFQVGHPIQTPGWGLYFLCAFVTCALGILFLPQSKDLRAQIRSRLRFQLDFFSHIVGIAYLQLSVAIFPRIEQWPSHTLVQNLVELSTPFVTLFLAFATGDAVVRRRQTGRQELALRLLAAASIWNLMGDTCFSVLLLKDSATIFAFRHWLLVLVSLGTSMTAWMLSESPDEQQGERRSTLFDEIILPQLLLAIPFLFLGVFWFAGVASPTHVVVALFLTLISVMARLVVFSVDIHGTLKAKDQAFSDLRSAQSHLVENGKLSALGSLVAGVAHELNTPLGNALTATTNMSSQLAAFRARLHGDTLSRNSLEKFLGNLDQGAAILQASLERSAELVRSFKQVGVEQSLEPSQEIVLKPFLEQVASIQAPVLRSQRHTLWIDCPSEMKVILPRLMLTQIVNQILHNASLHGYGEETPGEIWLKASTYEGDLVLTVRDTGNGMDAATLEHLYEPFFTTSRGKGHTGLGAHVVHSLVTRRLGGRIDVESSPGEGCLVRIEIPAVVLE
jgi:signal transduction histidine kinase